MLRIKFVASERCVTNLYVTLLFLREGTDEVLNGWVSEWNNTGYSLKYDTICKY